MTEPNGNPQDHVLPESNANPQVLVLTAMVQAANEELEEATAKILRLLDNEEETVRVATNMIQEYIRLMELDKDSEALRNHCAFLEQVADNVGLTREGVDAAIAELKQLASGAKASAPPPARVRTVADITRDLDNVERQIANMLSGVDPDDKEWWQTLQAQKTALNAELEAGGVTDIPRGGSTSGQLWRARMWKVRVWGLTALLVLIAGGWTFVMYELAAGAKLITLPGMFSDGDYPLLNFFAVLPFMPFPTDTLKTDGGANWLERYSLQAGNRAGVFLVLKNFLPWLGDKVLQKLRYSGSLQRPFILKGFSYLAELTFAFQIMTAVLILMDYRDIYDLFGESTGTVGGNVWGMVKLVLSLGPYLLICTMLAPAIGFVGGGLDLVKKFKSVGGGPKSSARMMTNSEIKSVLLSTSGNVGDAVAAISRIFG